MMDSLQQSFAQKKLNEDALKMLCKYGATLTDQVGPVFFLLLLMMDSPGGVEVSSGIRKQIARPMLRRRRRLRKHQKIYKDRQERTRPTPRETLDEHICLIVEV